MNCPACQVQLKITDRQGVEMDYCPQCRGVWLDRGELDKIIERSAANFAEDRPDDRARYDKARGYRRAYDEGDDRYRQGDKGRKRKSFLSDIFDFD